MNSVIEKVLAQLDDLGDSAIQKKILGVGDSSGDVDSPSTGPTGDTATQSDGVTEKEPDGDELSPELLEKLKALLAGQ